MTHGPKPITCVEEHSDCGVFLRVHFISEAASIGDTLSQAVTAFQVLGIATEDCATLEIVLAEVINNIAEHAYQNLPGGPIELVLCRATNRIHFELVDMGVAMPNNCVPEIKNHDLSGDTKDLPEGGFGWNLIRALVDEISYRRIGQENRLCVALTVAP